MSWSIFSGNLAKFLFLDSHAKNFQVRTYLDIFWHDLPRFSILLINMFQVLFHWEGTFEKNSQKNARKGLIISIFFLPVSQNVTIFFLCPEQEKCKKFTDFVLFFCLNKILMN